MVIIEFRCGTLVSADSTGSVQFWDSRHGTLLQAHTCHKGDVNALAAAPSPNRVFSAGSDGQVYGNNFNNYFAAISTNRTKDIASFFSLVTPWWFFSHLNACSSDCD